MSDQTAKKPMTLEIRGKTLVVGEYSDFDILPLDKLASVFDEGQGIDAAQFDSIMIQAWKSLQAVFGKSLPKNWFNQELCRIKLHVTEILLIAKTISDNLMDNEVYQKSRNTAAEVSGNPDLLIGADAVVKEDPDEQRRQDKIAQLEAELSVLTAQ